MLKQGGWRGEKIAYSDGVGCCIWEPVHPEGDEAAQDWGICIDFAESDIDDLIALLQQLKDAPAEPNVTGPFIVETSDNDEDILR